MYNGNEFDDSSSLSSYLDNLSAGFTSNLYHCVYPFTTSNKPRISIAGNLFYDSGDSKWD